MAKRYITPKACVCGVKTSALATFDAGSNLDCKGSVFYGPMGGISVKCRGCGTIRDAKLVQGKFSAKHMCSAKCLASTGFACECSCGGKNHGSNFSRLTNT